MIHVLLALDSHQVVGCAVTIRSILDNAEPGAQLWFHVMTSGVSVRDRNALAQTVAETKRGARVSFYEVDTSRFSRLLRSKLVTHTCYAPLLVAEVLPEHIQRCIYADCDLAVERDIVGLWEFSLEGKTLGAVVNGDLEDALGHQRRLGLRAPHYFNSGVLLIDLARWREHRVGERAAAVAAEIGDALILHDQDALNVALQDDWVELPWYWNVWTTSMRLTNDSAAVFHFMGAPKPWHADYAGRYANHFFRYAERTPFRVRKPWNPLGVGAFLARMRRRVPYLPAVLRLLRHRF